jgi:hypothetical protein
MFKPKTTIVGRLDNSSGEWIQTTTFAGTS